MQSRKSKLIFLGTGGDIYCTANQYRATGGIILITEDNQFHIDPGPGALVRARQMEVTPRSNTAVIVTHNHLNHANDANAVLNAMTLGGADKFGVLVGNKTFIQGSDYSPSMLSPYFRDFAERMITLEHGQRVGINSAEILATYAKHTDPAAIGLKIITKEFTVVYSSDTGYDDLLIKDYLGADILILNVVNPAGHKDPSNLSTDDAVEIIRKTRPRLAIITHFGVKMLQRDPINEAREIQKATSIQTIAAKDGLVINPFSHTVESGTKSLRF
ncbi:MBL fold metallo-hydrolase [Candidatus Woesearchaeota archaeon]|nr:MBL fold metallo-hydrolase [Candidatus Woesearchaeota archaeon]